MITRIYLLTMILLIAAAAAMVGLRDNQSEDESPEIEQFFPSRFAGWQEIAMTAAVLPAEQNRDFKQKVLYRAYKDQFGRIVTLVAAYGPAQDETVRLHLPESCYVAQGFSINQKRSINLHLAGYEVAIVELQVENPVRRELVSYMLRDGGKFITKAMDFELNDLTGRRAGERDGALLRLSTIGYSPALQEMHEQFLRDLFKAMPLDAKLLFFGEQT